MYIGSYNHHIDGLPVEEGRRITDELMAHVTQDKYKFSLPWENSGVRIQLSLRYQPFPTDFGQDIAFWDNTAVLHRATIGEYGAKYRRDMRRISTFDDSPWAYGENPRDSNQVGLS